MKALLVTIFKVPNFGSVLQAYATQQVLESMGAECKVLNYDHINSEWSVSHGVPKRGLKNKIGRLIGLKPHHRKERKLQTFTRQHLHLTKSFSRINDIRKEEGDAYDLYVVGSDQVWNTRFTNCDPVYLLEFVKDEKARRISVSSSFASKNIDDEYEPVFERNFKKFSCFSVREEGGVTILNQMGYDAKLVLDPTLLLSASQWNILRTSKENKRGRYILLYMLTYAFEPRPLIFEVLEHYQKKLGCKIIALDGYDDCIGLTSLQIEDATDSSVTDFLDLFANAALVVTSSFHGTAFALNYGRPLVSITPSGGDDRQGCLLDRLGLKQCQLKITSTPPQLCMATIESVLQCRGRATSIRRAAHRFNRMDKKLCTENLTRNSICLE